MIALDTNVLVRYLVKDDARQGKIASDYIKKYCTETSPGFISLITICEIVWVFRSAYKFSKDTVIQVLNSLFSAAELDIERSDLARAALKDYERNSADYADCLLGVIARDSGIQEVITFDRKASKVPCFRLLG